MFRSDTPTPARRRAARLAAGLVAAAAAVLLSATAASAHVKVDGIDATRGGYGVITFRVPTESATASTTGLTVTMPSDTPIASADVQPVPGWTATVSTAKPPEPIKTDDGEVDTFVSKITWKADDAASAIKPGEFQQFSVSVGPLPNTGEVSFPALQVYSDGTTVNWNEASSGGAEPEHPAPVLRLAAAGNDQGTAAGTGTTAATTSDGGVATAGLAVGIAGAVIAVVALVVAIIGLLRGTRRGAAGA